MEAATPADRTIVGRMMRAARLEEAVYEEVEHDRDATRQAAIVVVGTSILAAVGYGVVGGVVALVLGVVVALAGWAAYAWITYFIGTRLLAGPETSADWGELARTLGFANTPAIFLVLMLVEPAAPFVVAVVVIWMLAATIVALRAALDFSWWRAVGTALIGNIILGVLRGLVLGV